MAWLGGKTPLSHRARGNMNWYSYSQKKVDYVVKLRMPMSYNQKLYF